MTHLPQHRHLELVHLDILDPRYIDVEGVWGSVCSARVGLRAVRCVIVSRSQSIAYYQPVHIVFYIFSLTLKHRESIISENICPKFGQYFTAISKLATAVK